MMTNDKAIDCNLSLLEFMKIENMLHPNCVFADDNFEALEMAISALQEQDLQPTCNNLATDTISRTAAIDALSTPHGILYPIRTIENMPSAQPEQSTDIQDILQYLDNVIHPLVSPENWNVYSELHDMISNLPSAQFKINNQINLCDSCKYLYPACPGEKDDVFYGNGIGNDNICACNKYDPLKTKEDE